MNRKSIVKIFHENELIVINFKDQASANPERQHCAHCAAAGPLDEIITLIQEGFFDWEMRIAIVDCPRCHKLSGIRYEVRDGK